MTGQAQAAVGISSTASIGFALMTGSSVGPAITLVGMSQCFSVLSLMGVRMSPNVNVFLDAFKAMNGDGLLSTVLGTEERRRLYFIDEVVNSKVEDRGFFTVPFAAYGYDSVVFIFLADSMLIICGIWFILFLVLLLIKSNNICKGKCNKLYGLFLNKSTMKFY